MVDIKNTYQDFELENGEVVKLTLTFGRLNLLKSVNNELYNKFNNVLYGKSEDMLDTIAMLYVAYWCANYTVGGTLYNEQEFFDLVPFDMAKIKNAFDTLTQPKKK